MTERKCGDLTRFADENTQARTEAESIADDAESPLFENVDDLVAELLGE